MKRLFCLFGFHLWKRSRFVVLGSRPGEYDVHCLRCGKVENHNG